MLGFICSNRYLKFTCELEIHSSQYSQRDKNLQRSINCALTYLSETDQSGVLFSAKNGGTGSVWPKH